MKICICSYMFPDIENDIKKSKNPNSVSGHKFHENLIRGIDGCVKDPVHVINVPRIRFFPDYPQIIFHRKTWSHKEQCKDVHIGFINLFPLNIISMTFLLYEELNSWIKANINDDEILLFFNPPLPQLIAVWFAKKKNRSLITCACIGDLHGAFGVRKERGFIGFLRNVYHSIADGLLRTLDCYAFLTKFMADALEVSHKPFVVLEGMYADDEDVEEKGINKIKKENNNTIFYAGTLSLDYGIPHLLRAFSMIQGDYRLLLAGVGDAVDLVKDYSRKDTRIKYLGFLTPADVKTYQAAATVLVSPRTSEFEYVKYSFPSKTMEGLASGKPYIAHKLPCDPPEYAAYIQYAEDESDEALRDKMIQICSLSEEERKAVGQRASKFIKNEKNPTVMTERIVNMWERLVGERNA